MFFKLNPEVTLLKGEKESILIDMLTGKKHTFSDNDNILIENIYNNKEVDKETSSHIMEYLINQNLGYYFNKDVYIERIKTTNKATLQNDNLFPFKLNRLVIELTGKCNLNCLFCTEENTVYESCGCKKWESKQEIDYSKWINIIDQSLKLGIKECFISGGDPFIRWDLLKSLITHLTDNKIEVTIFTNGSLLDKSRGEFLKRKNVSLALQILSVEKQQFIQTTQDEGAFYNIMEAFNVIDMLKIPHTVSIIVSSINELSIDEIKSTLGKRNYQTTYIYPTNSYYSKKRQFEMMNPSQREIPINIFTAPYFSKYNNCLYGQIFVSSNSRVYPCMMIRDWLGYT
ncbi:radical SAM protein [Cytobacillus sp. Hm23]